MNYGIVINALDQYIWRLGFVPTVGAKLFSPHSQGDNKAANVIHAKKYLSTLTFRVCVNYRFHTHLRKIMRLRTPIIPREVQTNLRTGVQVDEHSSLLEDKRFLQNI